MSDLSETPPSIPLQLFFRFMDTPDTIYFDTIVLVPVRSNASVLNERSAASIDLYPDPSNDVLNVQLPAAAKYEVLDLLGRVLVESEEVANSFAVPTKNLSDGIYILRLRIGEKIESHRFVVRH